MYTKIDRVELKHRAYNISDKERKMLYKWVDTPEGAGRLIDIFEKTVEVEFADRKEYFPKDEVSLTVQPEPQKEPSSKYNDTWHQACLREAANTPTKRNYIFGKMSLNDYRKHEKEVYGTINA